MQVDDIKLFDACCMAPCALPAAESWPTRVYGRPGWKGRLRGPMPLQELLRAVQPLKFAHGLALSAAGVTLLIATGIRYFRHTERTFADVI